MPRVAITSTAERAEPLSALAQEHGLQPVRLPCIEVVPASDHVLRAGRVQAQNADWILVTSVRAVELLWPDAGMPEVPVAAVGPATAKAVRQAGGTVTVIGEGGAGALIRRLSELVSGRSVFFPGAAGADLSGVGALEQAGAQVTALVVYEARPIPPASDPVDAVIFGSPSAVSGWCRSRTLDDLVVAAIGERTRAALRERGHEPDVVPPRPDFTDLIAGLAVHLAERSAV